MKIPYIDDERLGKLADRIKLLKIVDNKRHLVHLPAAFDLRNKSFSWDEHDTSLTGDYKFLTNITTFHTWSYYGFFKPTMAEVLAQIPENIIEEVAAFTTNGPNERKDMFDGGIAQRILNEGFQIAITTLYSKYDPSRDIMNS